MCSTEPDFHPSIHHQPRPSLNKSVLRLLFSKIFLPCGVCGAGVHSRIGMQMYMPTWRSQKSGFDAFLYHFPPVFCFVLFETKSLTEPRSRKAGQWASGIHLSPCSPALGYKHFCLFASLFLCLLRQFLCAALAVLELAL